MLVSRPLTCSERDGDAIAETMRRTKRNQPFCDFKKSAT